MIRTLALFSLALISFVAARPTNQKCSIEPADIVFVVDTSTSIWEPDFQRYVRPFVSDVVQVFNIGPGEEQSRVGMVTFGNTHHHEFYLNDYLDKDALVKKIQSTPLRGGNTKTNEALDYMRNELFAPENGARDYATRIAIILTDGRSDDTSLTKVAAQKARNEGIEIYAIGVGYKIGVTELKDIASDPDSEHMFFVAYFQALTSIMDQLVNHTCGATAAPTTSTTESTTQTSTTRKPTTTTESTTTTTTTTEPTTTTTTTTTTEPTTTTTTTEPTTTTTTTTTTEPTTTTTTSEPTTTTEKPQKEQPKPDKLQCKSSPADIFFVLDTSSSLYIKDFNKVLPFVSSIVRDFDISPDHTRVGIVTFSLGVTPIFGLDEYLSAEEVQKAINKIAHEGGRRTDTAEAIAYVRDIGFAPRVARKGVTKMVVVITDGMSYDPALTAKEAKAAKDAGITTFAIGVGKSIDRNEMRAIASEPEEEFVYRVTDFDALAGVQDFLRETACKVKRRNPVTTPEECSLGPADIMFVFESASKLPASRSIMNSVITDFAENLKVKARDVRVGSLTDPCPVEEDMNLLTLNDFQERLRTIVTNTKGQMYRLLKTLRTEHFSVTSSRRQVAVLFVDEQTRNPAMTVREARRLKQAGVEVYVVVVGDVADYMVYEAASEPEKSHIIRAKNYPHLKSMKLNKLWNICSEVPRVTRKPFVFKRQPM